MHAPQDARSSTVRRLVAELAHLLGGLVVGDPRTLRGCVDGSGAAGNGGWRTPRWSGDHRSYLPRITRAGERLGDPGDSWPPLISFAQVENRIRLDEGSAISAVSFPLAARVSTHQLGCVLAGVRTSTSILRP